MALYVDADACPVKEEVYRVARRYELKVFVVANSVIRGPSETLVEMVVVSGGFDVADDWIAERAARGDIVITSDIPLAGRCIETARGWSAPRGSSSPRTRSATRWRPGRCTTCSASRAPSAAAPRRSPRPTARGSCRSSTNWFTPLGAICVAESIAPFRRDARVASVRRIGRSLRGCRRRCTTRRRRR